LSERRSIIYSLILSDILGSSQTEPLNIHFGGMIILDIDFLHLIEGAQQARGLTVIIDVFRAFSTACYAVRNGAVGIVPVGHVDVAYRLKEENPDIF
jgi:hypothetical protein